ncbi:MAG: hypothetical protein ABSD29_07645 [Verrucomicrobiota bacterium]
MLDFYHGSEHLWELGRVGHGQDEAQAKPWVERRLHQLRQGQERVVLKEITALKQPRGRPGQVVRKEQNYFASQAGRMNYQAIAERGWSIGSGAVESACRQSQRVPGSFLFAVAHENTGDLVAAAHEDPGAADVQHPRPVRHPRNSAGCARRAPSGFAGGWALPGIALIDM